MAPVGFEATTYAIRHVLSQSRAASKMTEPSVVHGPIFHSNNLAEEGSAEARYMSKRRAGVQQYFKNALGVDDFLARVEIELCKHGFTGDNSIGIK